MSIKLANKQEITQTIFYNIAARKVVNCKAPFMQRIEH